MTERNQIEAVFFAKMFALFLWGIISIIAFAGVMNYCPEALVKWCSGIVLAINILVIWRYAKRLVKDKLDAIEVIQEREREELVKNSKK